MSESIETQKRRIEALNAAVSRAREEKIRDETNLEQATKRREEIIEKMADLGYTPEDIEDAIKEKETALENILTRLEKEVLPTLSNVKDVIF